MRLAQSRSVGLMRRVTDARRFERKKEASL